VKRTAKWKWEDHSEWEVFVHKEGEKEVRTFRPPVKVSHPEDESKGALLAKAIGKLNVGPSPTVASFSEPELAGGVGMPPVAHVENDFTDQDGWIYGDNKWENTSTKAGMGKVCSSFRFYGGVLTFWQFTRFRRWHRMAVLEEEEEYLDEVDVKPSFTQTEAPKPPAEKVQADGDGVTSSHSKAPLTRTDTKGSPERSRGRTTESISPGDAGSESRLQQRLKAALKSGT
jgi:hypothetical protein